MALSNNPTPNELVKAVKALEQGGGGSSTDVQVDSVSQVSGGVANLKTINGNYNANTNKLATESDIPIMPEVKNFSTGSGNSLVNIRVFDFHDEAKTLVMLIRTNITSTEKTINFNTITGYTFAGGGSAGDNTTYAMQGTQARLQVNLHVYTTYVTAQSDSGTNYNWWCLLVGKKA